jgi:hypothetical protein
MPMPASRTAASIARRVIVWSMRKPSRQLGLGRCSYGGRPGNDLHRPLPMAPFSRFCIT